MWYDIEDQDPSIFTSKKDYIDFCGKEYFSYCKDLSVLEVGPSNGHHTKSIIQQSPQSLCVVEGDPNNYEHLKDIAGISQIYIDDVMSFLRDKQSYDVVICLGVLYHMHSPLHLLELIVNNCSPKYVILDCVMAPRELQFIMEEPWVPGNNQPRSSWKSCNMNLVVPFLTYLQSFDNLGYQIKKVNRVSVKDFFPKQNSWMAIWEIKK